jgi:hypothetical protein
MTRRGSADCRRGAMRLRRMNWSKGGMARSKMAGNRTATTTVRGRTIRTSPTSARMGLPSHDIALPPAPTLEERRPEA